MNATRWPSLTEFVKFLGREGICRVEESDKGGLEIAWVDNSPEALRRQDAIRKKDRQDKGDADRERRLVLEQVERARKVAELKNKVEIDDEAKTLQREEGEKIKLNFVSKVIPQSTTSPAEGGSQSPPPPPPPSEPAQETPVTDIKPAPSPAEPSAGVKLSLGGNKPKNVFSAPSKKNALGGSKSGFKPPPPMVMSEAERIMKEEIARKRNREAGVGFGGVKRQKVT